MRTLRLPADYDCWARWLSTKSGTENADPADSGHR